MRILAVTNNPEAQERLVPFGIGTLLVEGDPSRALFRARDLLAEALTPGAFVSSDGVRAGDGPFFLAADPMAGYRRPFPYRTVFLTDDASIGADPAEGILRMEKCANHLKERPVPAAEDTERIRADYAHLDADLAYNTCSRLCSEYSTD